MHISPRDSCLNLSRILVFIFLLDKILVVGVVGFIQTVMNHWVVWLYVWLIVCSVVAY